MDFEINDEDLSEKVHMPASLCKQCMDTCVQNPFEAFIDVNRPLNKNIQEKEALLSNPTACSMFQQDSLDIPDEMDVDEVQSTDYEIKKQTMSLKENVFLPNHLCEPLFQLIVSQYPEEYIQIFADTSKCRLSKIDLSREKTWSPIKDQRLIQSLCQHPLKEINLSGFTINPYTLPSFRHCANSLKVLDLSYVDGLMNFSVLGELKSLVKLNLKSASIQYMYSVQYMAVIGSLPCLTWLDLSCTSIDDAGLKELLPLQKTLQWFALYNCNHLTDMTTLTNTLKHFKQLVHLDVSKDPVPDQDEAYELELTQYPAVSGSMLEKLAMKLPKLTSLDISGTPDLKCADLEKFMPPRQKLQFLGLCKTGLSRHSSLPAKMITGEGDENQILESLRIYMNRRVFVTNALRELFNLSSRHECNQVEETLKLILEAMSKYKDSSIHIAATASLYHLSRGEIAENQNPSLRRAMITAILDSMESIPSVLQLQKNCCLTICNFKIPTELNFQYLRAADLMLAALSHHKDDYLRRIAVMVFNAIVCHNAGTQKKLIGQKGAIKILLQIIREKLVLAQSDSLLETCWSALWNITDETAENCKDFLDHDGMELFVKCLREFPDSQELHRNMMGLMGNVAEVATLRSRLMNKDFVDLFIYLLDSNQQGLEVSYNSAGVLSHMLSDGEEAWSLNGISRLECMIKIEMSIDSWDLQAQRNINYRSFEPILRLLPRSSAPAAQHWATWALANLTNVYPDRYCELIRYEHGVPLLEDLIKDKKTNTVNVYSTATIGNKIRELAELVIIKIRALETEEDDVESRIVVDTS